MTRICITGTGESWNLEETLSEKVAACSFMHRSVEWTE